MLIESAIILLVSCHGAQVCCDCGGVFALCVLVDMCKCDVLCVSMCVVCLQFFCLAII